MSTPQILPNSQPSRLGHHIEFNLWIADKLRECELAAPTPPTDADIISNLLLKARAR